jgi:pseudouridine synthase
MSKKIRLLSLLMRSGEFRKSYDAEQAIKQGRVQVNGKPATNPQHSVKLNAILKVNGRELKAQPLTYIILNKTRGVVCQKSPKEKTVFDLINTIPGIEPKTRSSLFCVGRLDRDTEGLLVMTNDGQLEKTLTRDRIPKTYLLSTINPVSDKDITRLLEGVQIRDDDSRKAFQVKALSIKRLGPNKLEMAIDEGRKRQVKKMLLAVGNEVVSLKRVAIGKLRIESLDFKGKAYIIASKAELKLQA